MEVDCELSVVLLLGRVAHQIFVDLVSSLVEPLVLCEEAANGSESLLRGR